MVRKWNSIVPRKNFTLFSPLVLWSPSGWTMSMQHELRWKQQVSSSLALFNVRARRVGIIFEHRMGLCLKYRASLMLTNEGASYTAFTAISIIGPIILERFWFRHR